MMKESDKRKGVFFARRWLDVLFGLTFAVFGVFFLLLVALVGSSASLTNGSTWVGLILCALVAAACLIIAGRALKRPSDIESGAASCCRCGVTTVNSATFFSERKTFSLRQRFYCPMCWSRRRASKYHATWFIWLTAGLLGLWLLRSHRGWAFVLLNFFFLQTFEVASALLHEFGHAVAARRLGMRVFKICFGHGRAFYKSKWLGFKIEISKLPFRGLVLAAFPERQRSGTRLSLYAAAGSAVNAALAIVSYALIRHSQFWNPKILTSAVLPFHMLFYSNALLLIVNLWPRSVITPYGIVGNDGKQFVKDLRLSQEELQQHYVSRFLLEGIEQYEEGRYEEARGWFEKGLELSPKDPSLQMYLGTIFIYQMQWAAARSCFQQLLPTEQDPTRKCLVLNNIAYADAVSGDPALLIEADQFSQESMATIGWMPAIVGTRGTVLVFMNRMEEGIPLLMDSIRRQDLNTSKAQNYCILAMAEAKRGNSLQASQHLDEARRLDPTCFLLERTESALCLPAQPNRSSEDS